MHPFAAPGRSPIEIGLLNNAPDAALHASERQFTHLLRAAAGADEVRLQFFSLPQIARGDHTRTYMRGFYGDLDDLFDAGLDGLIVTGAEPSAADLADEPYWESLTQLIDWAETGVAASYWSGAAAHAAVQHLDGLLPTALGAPCCGVFTFDPVGEDPMLAHRPKSIRTPHARDHGLDPEALTAHGYAILTQSTEAGVDSFVRREGGLMVLAQGHPEYDAETLLADYCREVGRFLCGERDARPPVPTNYLNRKTTRTLGSIARRKPAPALIARYNAIAAMATPRQVWRSSAVALFRNWLHHIAASKVKAARTALKSRSRVGLNAHP